MALLPFGDPFGGSLFDPFTTFGFGGLPVTTRQSTGSRQQHQQPMDIEETDTSYEIYSDVPGMKPEEITLEYSDSNQVLTIKGEHEDKQTKDRGGFTRTERVRRSFTRSFTVPSDALPDQMSASIENGVLNVHVPKRPVEPQVKAAPRRIPITGGSTKAQVGGTGKTQAQIGGASEMEGQKAGAATGAGGDTART
jgi:HSP20 family protein